MDCAAAGADGGVALAARRLVVRAAPSTKNRETKGVLTGRTRARLLRIWRHGNRHHALQAQAAAGLRLLLDDLLRCGDVAES
jgi:hypothetical protein